MFADGIVEADLTVIYQSQSGGGNERRKMQKEAAE
jgi:hypothetical protein